MNNAMPERSSLSPGRASGGMDRTSFAATEAWLASDTHAPVDPAVLRRHLICWARGDSHAMLSSRTLRAYHLVARELDRLIAVGCRSHSRLRHARAAFRAALVHELQRRGARHASLDEVPADT